MLVIKTCARFTWFAAWWRFCKMETSFVHELRPHRFGRYGSIIDWILLSASTKTYHRLRHLRPHKGKWSIRFEFTLNPCFLPVESLFLLMKSHWNLHKLCWCFTSIFIHFRLIFITLDGFNRFSQVASGTWAESIGFRGGHDGTPNSNGYFESILPMDFAYGFSNGG